MYLALICGLIGLVVCGDILVLGAIAAARRLGISSVTIGLTLVAFATSAPELVISVDAALDGATGIALGNVVGSNIANILLALGLPAIFFPLACSKDALRTIHQNALMMVGGSIVCILICFSGVLTFWLGTLMFSGIILFIIYCTQYTNSMDVLLEDTPKKITAPWMIVIFIIIGLVGLPISAELTIYGAVNIASTFNIPDSVIGLTAIAIGTSLPELAATFTAALRRQTDIVIGNVIGSNIFNLFAVMGLTAMVHPVPIPEEFLHLDLWVMLVAALLVLPFSMTRGAINRTMGCLFFAGYIFYIGWVFQDRHTYEHELHPDITEVVVPNKAIS